MSRYIDAEKIKFEPIDITVKGITRRTVDRMATEKEINAIPTADVEEVRHEKWIFGGQKKTKSGYRFTYHCSRCFRLVRRDLDEAPINEIYPYCHCGARMDKEKEK